MTTKPQAIWDAITSPEWTQKYGYRAPSEYELRPGGKYRGLATEQMKAEGASDVLVDGEVIEADAPHKLVQTWRALWDPDLEAEGFTRLTWETREEMGGITRLTVTHELEGAPRHAEQVAGGEASLEQGGGGWPWILSDLKSLLETGKSLAD
jgi:uncharacterized protein YndB with AHSA1/START domain